MRDLTPYIIQEKNSRTYRSQLALDITISNGVAPLTVSQYVTSLYLGAFARAPLAGELTAGTTALNAGCAASDARGAAETLAQDLFASAEYGARARSDEDFVRDLYLALLGRPGEEGGVVYWASTLSGPTPKTRPDLVHAFAENAEHGLRLLGWCPNVVIRLATGAVHVKGFVENAAITVVSRDYSPGVKVSPSLSFSKGAAPEGGNFTLQNYDLIFGKLVGDPSQMLDGSAIVVWELFLSEDGVNFYADQVAEGSIRDAKADGSDCVIALLTDMSDRKARVATRSLSQRCLAVFGGRGCWYPKQPGQTCSMVYDDAAGGCLFYGWQSQFWGAPFFSLVDPIVALDGFDPDLDRNINGGWGRGGRPDPWERMPFMP